MKYFTLTAFDNSQNRIVPIFGDYEREVVKQEMVDQKESYQEDYTDFKIITTFGDQDSIDAKIQEMNSAILDTCNY